MTSWLAWSKRLNQVPIYFYIKDIEKEQEEYEEICQTNEELAKQQTLLTRKLEQLKTEMAAVQIDLEKQKQEYEIAVAEHEAETKRKESKLKLYQELLGLEIETVKGTDD